jgi:serine/threonine-protein kinase
MAKLPCPPELWTEFSALLDEALDLPESSRPVWLAGLGSEHAAVKPWLAQVMTRRASTLETNFLRGPPAGAQGIDDAGDSEFHQGQQIGPYLLEQRLGSGGMGEVWLASRSDGTLRRRVALKLPHRHLFADALRRRFDRERDILAGLSHPHIAQLYDAGVADHHFPYLAMEWVDGVSMTDHCRNSKLSLDRRLDLFLQILDAVGYAHGRLIAHRDLKPSNVLVTRDECVKLLDFGIAKLLTNDTESGETQLTRAGNCLATPSYAAPEQLAGEPITAAVDIFALGVVLHELLTGERPVRSRRPFPESGADAARASSRIDPAHAATVGGLDARKLRRALLGDLDAIIAKALESDPARRYQSAEAFALDIRQSRAHLPISARRISPATLSRKFVRRHRLGVAMSLLLLMALVGGSAGIAWQAVRAEREAQRATTIKDFLIGMFRASDPRIAADKPRGEITAKDLLDVSSKQIESGFAGQPDTQIELLRVIADIYRELDETHRSTALYVRETELAGRYHGSDNPAYIDGLLGQADNADTDGDDTRALALLDQADPLIHDSGLDKSALRAHWLLFRGESLFGDSAKSSESQAELTAAAVLFKAVAPHDPRYPDALIDLGSLSLERSQFSQSADYYRQAIDVAQPNSQLAGNTLLAYGGLALALRRLGDFKGAERAFDSGTDVAARTYGHAAKQYWMIASDWAQFRYERGERVAGLAAFETLLKSLPDAATGFANATDAMEAAHVLRKYGYCLAVDGAGTRAVALLERARSMLEKSAPHAFDAGRLQLDLGSAYEAAGRMADAREAYSAALTTWQAQRAPATKLGRALAHWGGFLLAQNDANGAEAAFRETIRQAAGHPIESAIHAQAGLAQVALARSDAPTALAASDAAMSQLAKIEGYYDVRLEPYVWAVRARSLLLAGNDAAARALAQRARDATLAEYAPGSPHVSEADALAQSAAGLLPAASLQPVSSRAALH